jgi:HAE1 family hydrophobic/amphiphilic exporter-1
MIEFFVKRPISALVICIGILVLGSISYQRIPIQLMPEMNIPEFKIITSWGSATSEEVENQITIPIERAVSTVSGLKSTSSRSLKGTSEILLKFKSNIDIPKVVSEIKDRLDGVVLPDGSKKPRIVRFQSSSQSVAEYLIQPKIDLKSLSEIQIDIEDGIKRELEKIDGVALVQLIGVPQKLIKIDINPIAMQSFGLSLQSITDSIQNQNRTAQTGQIDYQGQTIPVKVGKQLESKEELLAVTLKTEGQKAVRLSDIAQVNQVNLEDGKVRMNSKSAILLQIKKEAEANTVTVGRQAREMMSNYIRENKNDYNIVDFSDQGKEIEMAVNNVKESVITGAILAAFIIYLLLQSGWTSFVITSAIPISLMITLILMYFTGVTLNLMSLAGLALGVGMLVDNSTVVLGSIYEKGLETKSLFEAAIFGTQNVVGAITSSTLSTIAVFAPLVFIEGEIGFLFKDVALTMCYSIFASLLVAVTVVPCLTTQKRSFIKNKHMKPFKVSIPPTKGLVDSSKLALDLHLAAFRHIFELRHFLRLESKVLKRFNDRLGKVHDFALNLIQSILFLFEKRLDRIIPFWINRIRAGGLVIIGTVLIGAGIISSLGADLFPEEKINKIQFQLLFPPSRIVKTNEEQIYRIENRLGNNPLIQNIIIEGDPLSKSVYRLTVFTKEGQIDNTTKDVVTALGETPDLQFNRQKQSVFGGQKPIQLLLFNDDLNQLKKSATDVMSDISRLKGLSDLESNLDIWTGQIQVNLIPEKMSYLGIDPNAFISLSQSLLDSTILPPFAFGTNILQAKAQASPSFVNDIDSLGNIALELDQNRRIYLRQISEIKNVSLPAELRREDRTRVAVIQANLNGWDLEKASTEIKNKIDKLKTEWKFGGQKEEQEKSTKNLFLAIAFSIFLIYLISASQFESLTQPFVVLLAVPSSILGVGIFLILFGLNFSALVLVGFIILVGASVNTSIVMVDYANQLMIEGANAKVAIIQATKKRMRSIVVTTAANILGLLPMAFSFGEPGSSMQQPLSVTLIGGLLSSTLITLMIVPAFYVLIRGNGTNAS